MWRHCRRFRFIKQSRGNIVIKEGLLKGLSGNRKFHAVLKDVYPGYINLIV